MLTKHITTYILLSMIMLAPNAVFSEIYKWTDKEGNVHFSDKPVNNKAKPVTLKSTVNAYKPSAAIPEFKYTPSKKIAKKNPASGLQKLNPGQVVMYSTTWCGFCKKAKAYFRKKGIAYSEHDIEKSPQARKEYNTLGGGGVPLILIGKRQGNRKMSGFSVATFENHYQK